MSDSKSKSSQLAVVLKYQGAVAAEGQLTEIANKEGDEAVARITGNLTSAEVSQLTSGADITSPSLLHTAINFDQFRGVFRRVGVRWSRADEEDCSPETIREYQEEMKHFFCAFILLNEEEPRRVELLKIILDEPFGINALIFSVVHEKDFPEFMTSDGEDIEIGDWREVIGLLRVHFPIEWNKFKNSLPSSYEGANYYQLVSDIAAEMYSVAVSEGSVDKAETEETSDLFKPLQ